MMFSNPLSTGHLLTSSIGVSQLLTPVCLLRFNKLAYSEESKKKDAIVAHYFEDDGWSIGTIILVPNPTPPAPGLPAEVPYYWVKFQVDDSEVRRTPRTYRRASHTSHTAHLTRHAPASAHSARSGGPARLRPRPRSPPHSPPHSPPQPSPSASILN